VSYARRTDRTHAVIRDTLRKLGWLVLDCSRVGGGFPDLVCIKAGRVVFAEVKDGAKSPSRRKLEPMQAALHAELRAAGAEILVLCSEADVQTWAA
jgi:hypothetical protein